MARESLHWPFLNLRRRNEDILIAYVQSFNNQKVNEFLLDQASYDNIYVRKLK